MKNIKIGSIMKVRSINVNERVMIVAVERNMVIARTIRGKVITTHVRNIHEDK